MTRGRKILAPAIYSQGYCCKWGYLTLCRVRGEKQVDMASFLNIPKGVVKDGYYLLKKKGYRCQNNSGCLSPVIEEIGGCPSNLSDNPHRPDASTGIDILG